jgi:hypothetical protein
MPESGRRSSMLTAPREVQGHVHTCFRLPIPCSTANFSLIGGEKFPVPVNREFGCKRLKIVMNALP